ncbi:MAG: hypothetical protein A2V88_07720 [Elusimicrobia bacterium RBG_16_66_12]|nr:MAG: hypothetical protein A2V88_07720 [Elusimicrobia bacterium RBG_16_66_12]
MIPLRLCTCIGSLIALAVLLLVGTALPAHAQPAVLVVEADEVVFDQVAQRVEATGQVRLRYRGIVLTAGHAVFDLRAEQLSAEENVVLIDASGREFRGERLTYDVRLELAEIRRGETVVDDFTIRSERLRAQPRLITAEETLLTPCDPARPTVRITAQHIEMIPGDRLVARQATLWVGRYRLFTLPVYVVSLRGGESTARSFPQAGYNNVDGLWVDNVYAYQLAGLPAALYTKLASRTGLIVRHTLGYQRPPFALELTVGRNQDAELRIFDQAETVLSMQEQRLGALPLLLAVSARTGWYDEMTTSLRTSRTMYAWGLRTGTVSLGSEWTLQGGVSWSDAYYGTGDRQSIWRADLGLSHRLGAGRQVSLTYSLLDVYGGTPFLFDAIDVDDRIHRGEVLYEQQGQRGEAATTFRTGLAYNFRDMTTSAILGYGRRVDDRYHWSITGEYNLKTNDTKLTVDVGRAFGNGTYATVQAIYHTLTGTYEDLDYIVAARFCDCIAMQVKYRAARQEIWLEVGLARPRP